MRRGGSKLAFDAKNIFENQHSDKRKDELEKENKDIFIFLSFV